MEIGPLYQCPADACELLEQQLIDLIPGCLCIDYSPNGCQVHLVLPRLCLNYPSDSFSRADVCSVPSSRSASVAACRCDESVGNPISVALMLFKAKLGLSSLFPASAVCFGLIVQVYLRRAGRERCMKSQLPSSQWMPESHSVAVAKQLRLLLL